MVGRPIGIRLLYAACFAWVGFKDLRVVRAQIEDGDPHLAPPASLDPDAPVPDKVGAEVRLTKKERSGLKKLDCGMCKAILREMHIEVAKHKMIEKGESQVWETSNAMCLAMLQKYRLDMSSKTPTLEPKAEDDEEFLASGQVDTADYMRSMLVLKMGCQAWLEDYGGDVSGHIFKAVRDGSNTADGVALDFCTRTVSLCGGKSKKEKKKKEKEKDRARLKEREASIRKQEVEEKAKAKEDPFSNLPEDSKMGLQRMLEMARDDPLHYMEDDAKARIQQARKDLRCEVCRVVLEDVNAQVTKRPKSMQAEFDILPFVEVACSGGKDLSVPSYFGVEPPPLPALWTDRVRPHLEKGSKVWGLTPFAKKAKKKRAKWRLNIEKGKHEPPPGPDSEGDMMFGLACKDMLEPARFTEVLYAQMRTCGSAGCDAALAAAREVCKTPGGDACVYDKSGSSKDRSQEL